MARKHCGKSRNCSLRAISPFPTVFSKGLFLRASKGVIVWEWVKQSVVLNNTMMTFLVLKGKKKPENIVGEGENDVNHQHGNHQHGNHQHGNNQHGNHQHGNHQHGNHQHGNHQHGNNQHGNHQHGNHQHFSPFPTVISTL